jgi:hypothetical protein
VDTEEEPIVLIVDIGRVPIAIKKVALPAELHQDVNILTARDSIAENLVILMQAPLDVNNAVELV